MIVGPRIIFDEERQWSRSYTALGQRSGKYDRPSLGSPALQPDLSFHKQLRAFNTCVQRVTFKEIMRL